LPLQLLPMLSHVNQNPMANLWGIAHTVEPRLHQTLFSIQIQDQNIKNHNAETI